jgi:hypothetical protein
VHSPEDLATTPVAGLHLQFGADASSEMAVSWHTLQAQGSMSKTDQFRQYAEEALRWSRQAKTEKEKQAYADLALTWTEAALRSEYIFGVNASLPEVKIAL